MSVLPKPTHKNIIQEYALPYQKIVIFNDILVGIIFKKKQTGKFLKNNNIKKHLELLNIEFKKNIKTYFI